MLPEPPPEIHEAWSLGISIFAGEAEARMEALLQDARRGALKPLYDYGNDLPDLEGVPAPFLPHRTLRRNMGRTSFDAGRGCPFQCSFCTIINVQGRKSRHRSADDVEAIVRANHAQGVTKFFITDDNFARNRNWEPIFDRLIELREQGIGLRLMIQVDTLCHRIPGFVEKAGRAGVNRVFIGLENINPDNLAAAKKRQNRITEYRTMLQAWKAIGALTYAGYIIGFPHDTPARLKRDIEIIKRELPVDLLEFFYLTPLPGSEDHQTLHRNGVWMEPDLNNYDTEHVTTAHPLMSADEWRQAYSEAWRTYYDLDHVETLMRRAVASARAPASSGMMACGSMAASPSRTCIRCRPACSGASTAPTAGRACRGKARWSSIPATAGRSSPSMRGCSGCFTHYRYLRWRVESDPMAARYRGSGDAAGGRGRRGRRVGNLQPHRSPPSRPLRRRAS